MGGEVCFKHPFLYGFFKIRMKNRIASGYGKFLFHYEQMATKRLGA